MSILNIIESCVSSTGKYLAISLEKRVNLHKKLNELKVAGPSIAFHAECWHYTATNGRELRNRLESYSKIVAIVTHRATLPYMFGRWKDVSPDDKLYYLDEYKITKSKLNQHCCFKDEITRNDFYTKYNQFCANHKFDDEYIYLALLQDYVYFVTNRQSVTI